MIQRCCICKKGIVAVWIPIDPKDKNAGSYPVCSSESCKCAAWLIPVPKKVKELKG